jgi:hypothetical protein
LWSAASHWVISIAFLVHCAFGSLNPAVHKRVAHGRLAPGQNCRSYDIAAITSLFRVLLYSTLFKIKKSITYIYIFNIIIFFIYFFKL